MNAALGKAAIKAKLPPLKKATPVTTPQQGFDEAQRRARARIAKKQRRSTTSTTKAPSPLGLIIKEFQGKTYGS